MEEAGNATWCGGQGKGPKVRVCYVCGRGYGLSSYEIHLKQCKAKWEATQESLPKSERKPLPKEPEVGDQLGGGGSLAAQNEAAQQVFNNEALEACENCGRTFLRDRLKVHQKSCTQSSPAARVGASRLSTSSGTSPELGQTTTTTTAVPRPRTSRKSKTTQGNESRLLDETTDLCAHQGGALAGNYGSAGRRASRGFRSSQGASPSGSEQSALEVVEQRLAQVEQELVDTKAEVKGLREVVEKLSSSLKVS